MSYEYITDYDAVFYMPGRMYHDINYNVDKIVIHHWGADGQTFDDVVAWFCNPSCTTSAHYVVEAGKVACLVNLGDTAYHAGDLGANLISIGIECRPEMSAADLETVCELVAYIFSVYGPLPIYGHKDFSATRCPYRYYTQLDHIYNRAMEIYNGNEQGDTDMTKEEVQAIVKEMQKTYDTLAECPTFAQPTVQKLINKGLLVGGEGGKLDLTYDLCRMLVVNDRAGIYGE